MSWVLKQSLAQSASELRDAEFTCLRCVLVFLQIKYLELLWMNDLASLLASISESLRKRSLSVSCAESVTVGQIQSLLATNSGASAYFLGGITAYNFEQKVRHLSIDPDHALACNCVSDRVAGEMAMGACNEWHCRVI